MKEFKKGEPSTAPAPNLSEAIKTGYAAHRSSTTTQLEYETLDTTADYQEKFALACYGDAGSGKTRLLATAPGIVGVVPLNRKTKQTVVETAKFFDKRIVLPKFDLIRSANAMRTANLPPSCGKTIAVDIYRDQPMCCAIHNGRWACDRTKQAALDMKGKCDSIGIDGFDIFTEDMLTAHYGRTERIMPKDRGTVNKEMIEFLGELSDRHLVLTMGQKEVWRNDKPTGEFDWAGWKHLNYHVNCIVHMKVREDYDEDNPKHTHRWSLTVIMSQARASLMGVAGVDLLTDTMITFPQLAMQVYPESAEEVWE